MNVLYAVTNIYVFAKKSSNIQKTPNMFYTLVPERKIFLVCLISFKISKTQFAKRLVTKPYVRRKYVSTKKIESLKT